MGLFKSMKDLSSLTEEAKQLQRQQQEEAGYKPGFGGQMQQMGDMISSGERAARRPHGLIRASAAEILADGHSPARAMVVAHGTPDARRSVVQP